MAKESMMTAKWVRMTLTQMGVDTQGLEISLTGSTVQIRGEVRKLKGSLGLGSDSKQTRLLEMISQRLRQHKAIKRVMFL